MFYQCAEALVCHDQYLVKQATFVVIIAPIMAVSGASRCIICVMQALESD